MQAVVQLVVEYVYHAYLIHRTVSQWPFNLVPITTIEIYLFLGIPMEAA